VQETKISPCGHAAIQLRMSQRHFSIAYLFQQSSSRK